MNKHIERLAVKAEKLIKTDIAYLTKGSFWLGLDQISSSGTSFLISILFANLLLPDAYGLYKYILSIMSILYVTTLTGMDPVVTQATARGYDGVLDEGIKHKMRWGLLGTLGAIAVATYYFAQGNNLLGSGFIIIGLFLPFTEAFDMYNSVLAGKKLFRTQALFDIARNAITLGALALGLFFTKNIVIILAIYLLSINIPNTILLYYTRKKFLENNKIEHDSIEYGKHLSGVYVISAILSELDKLLVFHYVGASQLALYTLATAPTDQIKGVLKNINSLALPKLATRDGSEIKKTLGHKLVVLFAVISITVVTYILLAPFFFKFFFPKYISAIIYSQLLALSLIPVVLSGFLYTILESQKAKKELYSYNIYTNIFGIILLLPFVYFYGIWGAVISRMITRTFTFCFSLLLVKRAN